MLRRCWPPLLCVPIALLLTLTATSLDARQHPPRLSPESVNEANGKHRLSLPRRCW
jgi:hypothetical protein